MGTKKTPLLDIKFKKGQEMVSEAMGLSEDQCHAILKQVEKFGKEGTVTSDTVKSVINHYTESPAELAFALMVIIPQENRGGSNPLKQLMAMMTSDN